jgi:hypothetical protein
MAASVATLATFGTWAANLQSALSLAVGFLTLAWWVRLWIKKPGIKPPGDYFENERSDASNGGNGAPPAK